MGHDPRCDGRVVCALREALVNAAATLHRPRIDAMFLREYRDHVGNSVAVPGVPGPLVTCACTFDGPDKMCDTGVSLWNVAFKGDWEDRKRAYLRRGRTGSP